MHSAPYYFNFLWTHFVYFGGLFFMVLIATWFLHLMRRGAESLSSWRRVSGRVKTFIYSQGGQEIEYEYSVDGVPYLGNKITVGSRRPSKSTRPIPVSRKLWLNPDRSLKFPASSEVTVYFNPRNPADSALVPGAPGTLRNLLIVEGILGIILLPAFMAKLPSDALAPRAFGIVFSLAGAGLIVWAARCVSRHRRTASFPSTGGKLLHAGIAYQSDTDSGGYVPVIDYEYSVNGITYRSRQITAINAQALSSKKKAEARLPRFQATPGLTVFYDPAAPWDCFLHRNSAWVIAIPLVVGLVFIAIGAAIFHSAPGHHFTPTTHDDGADFDG